MKRVRKVALEGLAQVDSEAQETTHTSLAPEEIAYRISQFDPVMCTQLFLSELQRVLPSPEQVGLNPMPQLQIANTSLGWETQCLHKRRCL